MKTWYPTLKRRARRADNGNVMKARSGSLLPVLRLTALLTVLAGVVAAPTYARVVFDGLDLAPDDRLLFSATSGGDGAPRQSVLFAADASTGALRQLTAFPENVDLLEGGRTLQVRNPFGAVRMSIFGGLPNAVTGFPSFASGGASMGGRAESMAASPDGKWILYVEPVSAAFGRLVLVDAATGIRTAVADGVERPGSDFPACWSPDSRVFVYDHAGKLYFRAVDSSGGAIVDERYRLVGDGRAASVRWGNAGDFFYIRGSTVYRVRISELFARALYADFLEIGSVAGKIPFEFDPNFDTFWVSPDSRSVLVSKGGRNLFFYRLGIDDYGEDGTASLPYLMLPRSSTVPTVLWSRAGIVTVLVSYSRGEKQSVKVYRLGTVGGNGNTSSLTFSELASPPGQLAALSPDGTRALVWGAHGAALYDYVNWKPLADLGSRATYACLWLGDEDFVIADAARIEKRNVAGQRSLICLSSSEAHGFEANGSRILAKSLGVWYASDGNGPWTEAQGVESRAAVTTSERYRAYLEKQASGPYENLPLLRNLKGVGTASLIVKGNKAYELVASGGSDDGSVLAADRPFTHGKRQGIREVSIIFDLVDDAEGLPTVLETLERFGVRATFFLNGEFIRRHPVAAKDIADAGQEAASMFFAPIDLSDARYRIDREFIRRGLARNEDEYFGATGGELALFWHPPYYSASADIIASASSVGYRTIGRDVDSFDWVTRLDARRSPGAYKSASELVDAVIAAKKPGSIIPIRLGVPSSGRDDYLYDRLDVLLDALVRSGYSVVPVSTLVEHAR